MNGFDSRASRPRRRWASWLVFVVGLLAGVGLAVPAALAAPGALSFAECNGDASGCTPTSPSGAPRPCRFGCQPILALPGATRLAGRTLIA